MKTPSWRPTSIFLIALSLSIGWGIRGNFGHEYGAMIGGVLAAIAAVLVSGREDWRARIPYVAMFGGLGWAFGGSISYMQVIAYTHSGHPDTVLYGFAATFLIGFLWAAMGGAGVALPLTADRDFLTRLFTPILWVFASWVVWSAPDWGVEAQIERTAEGFNETEHRQESPLYWFDADWHKAFVAILALCAYDLWNRYATARSATYLGAFLIPFRMAGALALFAGLGALIGQVVRYSLDSVGALWARTPIPQPISWSNFSRSVADPSIFDIPAAEQTDRQAELIAKYADDADPIAEYGTAKDAFLADTFTNWPQFFGDIPEHLGWIFGIIAGLAIYFAIFGKFRNGSALLMYMAVGWCIGFLLFPVVLGWRMTPPRADDWAGISGVVVATIIYMFRQGMIPVAYATIVSGFIGGIGFSGAVLLKLLMVWPGNKELAGNDTVVAMWQSLGLGRAATQKELAKRGLEDANVTASPDLIVETWTHWQSANWHSFYEQSYGFINGIAIAVVVALLSTRLWRADNKPRVRPWTEIAAIAFPLLLLLWLNLRKNVVEWVKKEAVPLDMAMPWFESVVLPTQMWFNIMWLSLCAAFLVIAFVHIRRPIALIPKTWLGRGQLLFLVFLWAIVIANFERALVGFDASRLLTEGVIFINAAIVTVLVLILPREGDYAIRVPKLTAPVRYARVTILWLIASAVVIYGEYRIVSYLYQDSYAGHAGEQFRFGDNAEWRVNPTSRTEEHN